jgi:hypothetical protein
VEAKGGSSPCSPLRGLRVAPVPATPPYASPQPAVARKRCPATQVGKHLTRRTFQSDRYGTSHYQPTQSLFPTMAVSCTRCGEELELGGPTLQDACPDCARARQDFLACAMKAQMNTCAREGTSRRSGSTCRHVAWHGVGRAATASQEASSAGAGAPWLGTHHIRRLRPNSI